jgi:hypothetical protein
MELLKVFTLTLGLLSVRVCCLKGDDPAAQNLINDSGSNVAGAKTSQFVPFGSDFDFGFGHHYYGTMARTRARALYTSNSHTW